MLVCAASAVGIDVPEHPAEHTKSREETGNYGYNYYTLYTTIIIVHLQSSNFLISWGATFDRGIFTTLFRILPVWDVTLVSCDVAGKNKDDVFQPPPTSLTAHLKLLSSISIYPRAVGRYTPTKSSILLPGIFERRVCSTCIARSCLYIIWCVYKINPYFRWWRVCQAHI